MIIKLLKRAIIGFLKLHFMAQNAIINLYFVYLLKSGDNNDI